MNSSVDTLHQAGRFTRGRRTLVTIVIRVMALGGVACSSGEKSETATAVQGYCGTWETRMRDCNLLGPGSTSCVEFHDQAEECETRCIVGATCEELSTAFCRTLGAFTVGICLANCIGLPPVTCAGSGEIPGFERCNGRSECPGGEDETGCTTATGRQFRCRNVDEFVTFDQQCDGRSDCSDGSDEAAVCTTMLTCGEGIKINRAEYCNGFQICPDAADEPATCAKLCP